MWRSHTVYQIVFSIFIFPSIFQYFAPLDMLGQDDICVNRFFITLGGFIFIYTYFLSIDKVQVCQQEFYRFLLIFPGSLLATVALVSCNQPVLQMHQDTSLHQFAYSTYFSGGSLSLFPTSSFLWESELFTENLFVPLLYSQPSLWWVLHEGMLNEYMKIQQGCCR